LIVAPVFYGVFYPQPYLGQLVRKILIAVVDDDRTPLSRRLIQALVRQTKGAGTDMPGLPPPRHFPTLPRRVIA
jgi:hypothetical protein